MIQDWIPRNHHAERELVEASSDDSQLHQRPLISQLLQSRSWFGQAEQLLNPRLDQITDPSRILNLDASVERIANAIANQEGIAIYGDYDIDGMSALSLLYTFFSACGAKNLFHYQPHRLTDGYGVHPEALEQLKSQGANVIITVDTGITACAAADKAQKLGLDLIITDHHQALEQVPNTPWIVNPNQKGDKSGLGYLSGTGVAFYFCMGLRRHLRDINYFKSNPQIKEPDLRYWLDLFALGTVSDHVPLVGDNRNLVRVGLGLIRKSHRPGLRALVDEVVPNAGDMLTARDISFSIAPKLNAASRLGQTELSTKLLMCQSHTEAEDLVIKLLELNATRSDIQKKVFQEAAEQAETLLSLNPDTHVLLLHGHWHEGVLGIVAAKVLEEFGKPTIILGHLEDGLTCRGSMRSLPWLSGVRLLESCEPYLIKFGGHDMAAGLSTKLELVEPLREALNAGAKALLNKTQSISAPTMVLKYDGDLPQDIVPEDIQTLELLGPWGEGNPEPLFCIKNLDLSDVKHLKELHLKTKHSGRYDVIGFFKSSEVKKLQNIGVQKIDALVRPEINRFRNTVSVQLRLEHIRASQS